MEPLMQTILMDVDGVLVTGRPQDGAHLFTDLEKDLGIPLAVLQRDFFTPRWPDLVIGKKQLLPELSAALSTIAPDVSAERLIDYWFVNDSRLDLDVLSAMDDLRASGNKVYLATNQEHMRATYLMETMGLSRHVDGIFYSAAIGFKKPSPGFYEHVSASLGSETGPITLVDDTLANIEAARLHGWRAIHWQPNMSLVTALATL
jgi:putative hydrolase of the HAD superfamily